MKRALLCVVIVLSTVSLPYAAEYNGDDLDGNSYSATAYSYGTAKYYNVSVEFSGDEATITFGNGGTKTLTMDDEDIDDPHDISCYDYKTATYWDIDVDDID